MTKSSRSLSVLACGSIWLSALVLPLPFPAFTPAFAPAFAEDGFDEGYVPTSPPVLPPDLTEEPVLAPDDWDSATGETHERVDFGTPPPLETSELTGETRPAAVEVESPSPLTTGSMPEAPPMPGQSHSVSANTNASRQSAPRSPQRNPQHNPMIPGYQLERPQWGVEFVASLKALGGTPSIPNLGEDVIRAFSLQLEYQPPFIQSFGILGIGPSVNFYPPSNPPAVAKSAVGLFSFGAQTRYQLRYFREQPLVPTAAYNVEFWNYYLVDGTSGRFWAHGPIFGGMLLLNFLDPSSAAEFFVTSGVSRSYAVVEVRLLNGGDEVISFSGYSLYFGLRVEM